ncbi:MAG TPA: ferrous iron transporter B, partial [Spirochaetota bacterium]|nr:ferrous iron transporter B [Spirochaetota bacterium]
MAKVLLIGNPNVGKSVVFNRLTGAEVMTSNYAGTTVEYTKGHVKYGDEIVDIIDIPGIYSLESSCKAEEIAVSMIKEHSSDELVVINIIDATKLERSLNLTLQLIRQKVPLILALNMWDEAVHTGIKVNIKKLEQILKVPCVATSAVKGEGIKELVEKMPQAAVSDYTVKDKGLWEQIGSIVNSVQHIYRRHHRFLERLSDLSVNPLLGLPTAVMVLVLMFAGVRFAGEGMINYLFEPLFTNFWSPLMQELSVLLGGEGVIHDLLIGTLLDGSIDYEQSFGMLTTGLYVPLAAVLPYVIAFYLVISFLEDSGYLPRLAVMVDTLMHKVGIHGLSIIPMLLGLGCNVPGTLATRVMETRRQRFIAITLLAIAVPCISLQSMIVALLGKYGYQPLFIVFGTLVLVWIILGLILNRFTRGESLEIFMEIPPYRIPFFRGMFKKLWIRIKWFLKEAIPFVILGVFIANLLYMTGLIDFIGMVFKPVVSGILGLAPAAAGALLLGFLRKDI